MTRMPSVTPEASAAAPVGQPRQQVVPRHAAVALLASTCVVIGLLWDVSWHRTVGRDTLWTLPHLLELLAAMLVGLGCGWLVLKTTFAGTDAERATSVRFWGFRGPLGAWVCIWSTFVMITSVPFDDWWHRAYGLDVKILSPPHALLALGMICLQLGALLLVLGAQNRTSGAGARHLGILYTYGAGLIVVVVATLVMEHAGFPNHMHSSRFYLVTGAVAPVFLVAIARSSALRWGATATAMFYMVIVLAMLWILPLFPAQSKLAPVYNPATHMVPPPFPLLLIAPALLIDVVLRRFGREHDWLLALLSGLVFVAVMLVVHWFWAEFLLSPGARNGAFGADQWDYSARLGAWRYQYWNLDGGAAGTFKWGRAGDVTDTFKPVLFARGLGVATLVAVVSSRLGLWWGNWLTTVKR
ncbi:MAG: hypothetical protein HW398_896 [Acidobacteria bacterium]|nr:hypothetical protein [Acidobacteriota bacterium]